MPDLRQRLQVMVGKVNARKLYSAKPLDEVYYFPCDYKKGSELPDVKKEGRLFQTDELWGGQADAHAWFYTKISVPEEYKKGRVELEVSTQIEKEWDATNPQFIVYVNGEIRQGLDINHRSVVLDGDGEYEIHIYAYTGSNVTKKLNFNARLISVNEAVERLFYNLSIPEAVLCFTVENSAEYVEILNYMNNALNLLDWRGHTEADFESSVVRANEYLEKEFYQGYCGAGAGKDVSVTCVGHTHIDIAWLWTMRQTVEKAQRSFATVIELMRRFPEYTFMSSQPYLYQAVKREAPALYEKIKERVKEGRWEAEGAMWVEADCNLISGESLVRQILFGKRFFKTEFDKDSRVLWLPDVFGYSAALPQILKKSGVDYFVTSKISWNDTNTLPNDTFYWRGIDGTEIFTHFLTAQEMKKDRTINRFAAYNAQGTASQVMGTWNRYQNKELHKEAILTYGKGDGGGGSTAEDVMRLRRLTNGIPGAPKAKFDTATAFLQRLEKSATASGRLPKWSGELYFEYHRGTYTSQARNKKNNRRTEYALQNAETLCAAAEILTGLAYPKQTFDELWEIALSNQFHDVIPGTSIRQVYEDCEKDYAYIFNTLSALTQKAANAIAQRIKSADGETLVFNPNWFAADGKVETENGTVYLKDVPAKGYKLVKPAKTQTKVTVGERFLENAYYRVEFDGDYQIARIYDKQNAREVLKADEKGNELVAFEDFPHAYDAWEIRDYYVEKSYPVLGVVSVEKVENGAGAALKITRRYGKSTIVQTVWLYDEAKGIDFETECDWQEEHTILKTFFPVDVNTDKALFDIQFGNCERPTHRNTSWERAKFEVCAHKYADVSEAGYGVALINDCKYGYSVEGTTLSLTLLKAPRYPDEQADKGVHTFKYTLYPHEGACRESDALRVASVYNNPLRLCKAEKGTGELPSAWSLVSGTDDGVAVETFKKAEDGKGYIVRLYETNNARRETELSFGFTVKKATACNLLEEVQEPLKLENGRVKLTFRPFEIKTVRVEL